MTSPMGIGIFLQHANAAVGSNEHCDLTTQVCAPIGGPNSGPLGGSSLNSHENANAKALKIEALRMQ